MDANASAEEEGGRRRDRQGCVGVIRESLGDSDPYSENAIHLLPCCINYTGPAEVSSYFKPTEMGKRRTIFFPFLALGAVCLFQRCFYNQGYDFSETPR
jgi:hypothetical protein